MASHTPCIFYKDLKRTMCPFEQIRIATFKYINLGFHFLFKKKMRDQTPWNQQAFHVKFHKKTINQFCIEIRILKIAKYKDSYSSHKCTIATKTKNETGAALLKCVKVCAVTIKPCNPAWRKCQFIAKIQNYNTTFYRFWIFFLVLVPLSGAYKIPIPVPIIAPVNRANNVIPVFFAMILWFYD